MQNKNVKLWCRAALFTSENLFMQPGATESTWLSTGPRISDPAAKSGLAPARHAATLAEGRIHLGSQGLHCLCTGLCLGPQSPDHTSLGLLATIFLPLWMTCNHTKGKQIENGQTPSVWPQLPLSYKDHRKLCAQKGNKSLFTVSLFFE